jgi:hypothetical protein
LRKCRRAVLFSPPARRLAGAPRANARQDPARRRARRPPGVRRRPQRRLAARRQQRRLLHRLLRPGRPAVHRRAAQQFTTFDRYFPSILSETFPNRIYQHAGQSDRISNTFTLSSLPTIWDRLAGKGLRGRYYYSDLPFLGLWGPKYVGISRLIDRFFADAAAGDLPEVAFVDGLFAQEATGTGNDDHPHVDIRNGEDFMNKVYSAVVRSPDWKDTVLFINFDEGPGNGLAEMAQLKDLFRQFGFTIP